MNLQTLKTEIAQPIYNGLTDQQIVDALNDKTITHYRVVEYAEVASYLSIQNKYLAISESVLDSGKNFMLAMGTFKTFDLNKPFVTIAVNSFLDAMVVDSLITGADKAAILSLGDSDNISLADQLWLPKIKMVHITDARII